MKKRFLLIASLLALSNEALIAQQNPTGTPPANITGPGLPDVRDNAQRSWYRGGNPNIGNGATNNIFGTLWNSPIYTVTNGVNRIKLNGNYPPVQYQIDGYTFPFVNTSGYMLLGPDQGGFYNSRGAFSQLHINGTNPLTLQPQDAGFRPWMKAGISFTDNDDFAYLGSRAVSGDVTEFTIAWGNNDGENFPGPDDMVFRFTTIGNGNMATSLDRTSPNDIDGRHIARFTPMGDFGLGNTFGLTALGYIRPQSQFHMSKQGTSAIFGQITNQATDETANDGLRWGVLDNQHAAIMQQENQPLRFFTDWDNLAGGTINGERMRIINDQFFLRPLKVTNEWRYKLLKKYPKKCSVYHLKFVLSFFHQHHKQQKSLISI